MTEGFELISKSIPDQAEANELMGQLIEVAGADSVFSEPVESGEYKVITASEVRVGMGYGFGGGGGSESTADAEEDGENEPGMGFGSGGGGGGLAMGRPVAAIEIGPHGVRVEPIVDPTKIAIAALTTFISMIAMFSRIKRASKG